MDDNNTFAKAQYIGSFSSKGGSIRAKGSIGASDRVDFYTYKILAGTSFTASNSGRFKGGTFDFSLYYKSSVTGKPVFANSTKISPSNSDSGNTVFPASSQTYTFYIKFSNPTRNVKYDLKIASLGF
jgi:hypothetical protein